MSDTVPVEVIIPALNEEGAIGAVVRGLLARGAARVIVVDNGSTDATARIAREAGAVVVAEPLRGYGRACLAGIAALQYEGIVVIADGDGCDDPADLPEFWRPSAPMRPISAWAPGWLALRTRRVAVPLPFWQLVGGGRHAPLFWPACDGHGALPRHSAQRAGATAHARAELRLERGNAGESRTRRTARGGGRRELPKTHDRRLEDHRQRTEVTRSRSGHPRVHSQISAAGSELSASSPQPCRRFTRSPALMPYRCAAPKTVVGQPTIHPAAANTPAYIPPTESRAEMSHGNSTGTIGCR